MKTFLILADGFEEIEAITVIDVLRRAHIECITVSLSEEYFVKGAHNIILKADQMAKYFDYEKGDMIILPGGMPGTTNIKNSLHIQKVIKYYKESNKKIAAICAAPSILGELEILKGERATCYPGFEESLIDAIVTDNAVEVSNNFITSRGVGTALDFALKLVEELKDEYAVVDLKKALLLI